MIVEDAADVPDLDEPGQLMRRRGLDLAGVLAQFRRDVVEAQRREQFGFRLARDRAVRADEPVLADLVTLLFPFRPQMEVVRHAAGEVVQGVGELVVGHDSQVAADLGAVPADAEHDAAERVALVEHLRHGR